MKHLLFILLALPCFCLASEPNEYAICIEYLTRSNPIVPPYDFRFQADEKGVHLVWTNEKWPKPTIAQLEAVKGEALEWHSNKVSEAAGNMVNVSDDIKIVIKALVKLVNKRLPANAKITAEELKQAIKEEK